MKKRLFILLVLIGCGFFIFQSEKTAFASTCIINCSHTYHDCRLGADNDYNNCLINYAQSYCYMLLESARSTCLVSINSCVYNCPDNGSGGGGTGGGGTGPGRTPGQLACLNARRDCDAAPEESIQCETSFNDPVEGKSCCLIEYERCMEVNS